MIFTANHHIMIILRLCLPDETTFCTYGSTNRQKCRYWFLIQRPEKSNASPGTVNNKVLRPFFFNTTFSHLQCYFQVMIILIYHVPSLKIYSTLWTLFYALLYIFKKVIKNFLIEKIRSNVKFFDEFRQQMALKFIPQNLQLHCISLVIIWALQNVYLI